MSNHLIDLWILDEEGRVIYSRADKLYPDDHLVGRLISALYTYTQGRFDDPLLRFTTPKHQYYIIEQQGILFTGRFPRDKTVKENTILKDLQKIRDMFFKRFTKEDLDANNYDIEKFIDF
ncbi:MAG: hypothetical protein ACFFBE_07800 [Promethearchaeota archaeon]